MVLCYVRVAGRDDSDEIARIQLATWRLAYRRFIPRNVLDQLDEGRLARLWRDAVVSPPSPEHRVLVAVEQTGQLAPEPGTAYRVGFAASGPADAAALAPDENHNALGERVVAVTELLVEPRWARRGHGSRLLAASVEHWRNDGYQSAVAWAFRDDDATIGFLTSAGWAIDGAARALDVEDLLVPQIRFRTDLTQQGSEADGEAGPAQH